MYQCFVTCYSMSAGCLLIMQYVSVEPEKKPGPSWEYSDSDDITPW
jgi:hypothetical protein